MKSDTPKNAVSDVVSDLIRAAVGSSARNVSDADVDKYVADLILKEAEEKRKKYNVVGVKAYLPSGLPDKPKPKPNTRFLLNMVKATDSHNQAVIKANEDNVAKLRRERLEREDERFRKAKQDMEARREQEKQTHRLSSSHRDHSYDNKRRKSRDDDSDSSEHHRERKKHKRKDDKKLSKHRRDKHDSSGRSSNRHHHRSSKSHHKSSEDELEEPTTNKDDIQYKGRGKVRINVSSMDKYFSKGYDPLLDVDSDKEEDEYLFAKKSTSKKRKHKRDSSKKSKKKKKKSHKHRNIPSSSSSSSSPEDEDQVEPVPKPVRAWDVGKVV